MRVLMSLTAMAVALTPFAAMAGSTCTTSLTGRTTCFNDDGTSTTVRPSTSGRSSTITNSDGSWATGRTTGRDTTIMTGDGDTLTARRSLNGRDTTVTGSDGSTTRCHTSMLGTTTTCF